MPITKISSILWGLRQMRGLGKGLYGISISDDLLKLIEFSTANLFISLLINLIKILTLARLGQYGGKNCTLI